MKNIILLALLSVVTLHAQRQVEFKETISKNQDVFLHFKFANDIKIEHGTTNDIVIKATVTIDEGEGNDAFSIKKDKTSGQLELSSDFGDYFKNRRVAHHKVDAKGNVMHNGRYIKGDCTTTEISYVVILPKHVNLKVKSISGSVIIDNFEGDLVTDLISGDVTIKKYSGALRLKTISGALDVTVNKAKLNAKSLTGTIYSDLEFENEASGKSYNNSHNNVSKIVNGGTEALEMETISGNIYIRKG